MQINTKKFLHFFTQYKNEWKEFKSEKNLTVKKAHLNILLDIMIMMTLDHYA